MTDHPAVLALTKALMSALDDDRRPPCAWPDRGPLWLSEDHRDRQQAAAECDGCGIFDACRDAAEVLLDGHRSRFGVFAGHDYTKGRRPTA